ncbi:MAG TPA: hypothetical protein VK074_11605 [Fodinibius sp.]|nr:hypothetical protein [Fodinibius sp.]
MKEQKKKRVIVTLLLISCAVSGYILLAASDGTPKKLQSLARADSLIAYELAKFNIASQQIRRSSITVDSSFNRKVYRINLSPGFSKTQLHAELNRTFHPLGISTPARVTFPDRQMRIHLEHEGTIVRTLVLNTDPDLAYRRARASIIVVLNEIPGNSLLDKLISFGEPIPVVLPIDYPMQANEFQKSLSGRYDPILFWLQNEEDEDLIQHNPPAARRQLKQLEDILPNARLLLTGGAASADMETIAARTALTFINTRNALRLHEELGKASFSAELNKLKSGISHPIAIVTGNETTLNWLGEKLPDLKKAGVVLVPPPEFDF